MMLGVKVGSLGRGDRGKLEASLGSAKKRVVGGMVQEGGGE